MSRYTRTIAVLILVGIGFSHLGTLIAFADSLAVVRPLLLIAGYAVVFALLFMRTRLFAAFVLVGVVASSIDTIWALHGGQGQAGSLSLYQKNMLWNGTDRQSLLDDILRADADFVTLQETSNDNMSVLNGLESVYPHRLACTTAGNGGIAIYSKYPLTQPDPKCEFGDGVVVAQAELPDGAAVWVASVHLNWPFPYTQANQVPAITKGLAALEGPILVGGDFNMVPWGGSVRLIEEAARAERLGGYLTTFPKFGWKLILPIDHILIPETGEGFVEVRPLHGSDHFGLLARFSI